MVRNHSSPSATENKKHLKLGEDIMQKLKKEFEVVFVGKNGCDLFVFWGSDNISNLWIRQTGEIPFGATIVLIAENHAVNTPVYCCIQYTENLISISQLSGQLTLSNGLKNCVVTIKNQILMNKKTLMEKENLSDVLKSQIGVVSVKEFSQIVKYADNPYPSWSSQYQDDFGIQKQLWMQIKDEYKFLHVQSNNFGTTIYVSRDTEENTPVVYLTIHFGKKDSDTTFEAGTVFCDKDEEGWKPITQIPAYWDIPFQYSIYVPEILESIVITNGNLKYLKRITVDQVISRVTENMPEKDSVGYYEKIAVIKAKTKKQVLLLIPSNHKPNTISSSICNFPRSVAYKFLKDKPCIMCRHGKEKTLEVYI